MSKFCWTARRAALLRQGTHTDAEGNIYKFLNGSLWVFKDAEYFAGTTYPCYSKVENGTPLTLSEREPSALYYKVKAP